MRYFTKHNNTPVGNIRVIENNARLTKIEYLKVYPNNPFGAEEKETPLLKETAKQLLEYFEGKRIDFDLPLDMEGSDFQKRVWEALCTIPYGETCTYKQVAEQVNCFKGARAVGLANHKNPIPIIVPCHRVIGADGSLTGYAGGVSVKKILLESEQKFKEVLICKRKLGFG